jgi:hypothetical protein
MHVPALALFISDDAFAVALDRTPEAIECAEFKNTSAGVEELLEWLDQFLDQEEAVDWIATVPHGEGGSVFKWLYDEIPDLFLQNPASLKKFAERANLPWNEARTLLTFHRNKVW